MGAIDLQKKAIYDKLKEIVYPIHAHSDQLVAIANWIHSEFEHKKSINGIKSVNVEKVELTFQSSMNFKNEDNL
jgi:formaldehyde-activating enzyme involved in methanogenesis